MRSKFAFSALVLLVAMTVATTAFAQATFTVSSSSRASGRMNDHTALTGNIALVNGGGSVTEGKIVIDFGATITNDLDTANGNNIDVDICSNTQNVTDKAVAKVSKSKLTITIATSDSCDMSGDVISVKGVRISLAGFGGTSASASVSTDGDVLLLAGSVTDVVVIRSIVDALTDDGVDVHQKVTLLRHNGEAKDKKSQFVLVLSEATTDAFRGGTELELEFSGIPDDEDVSITLDAWVAEEDDFEANVKIDTEFGGLVVTNNQLGFGSREDQERDAKVTAESDVATVILPLMTRAVFNLDLTENDIDDPMDYMGGLLSDATDVVVIRGTISGLDDDEKLPLGDLEIQVTADVGPTGKVSSTGIPRFSADPTAPVTIIEAAPDRNMMTFTLAISNGTFDTGIAVINTGKLTGLINFTFYNMDGTEIEHTTSASSPGLGLNTAGMLAPGGTYLVLLSEMLSSAFTGYFEVTTDFTGAEGSGYISDFEGFSSSVRVYK